MNGRELNKLPLARSSISRKIGKCFTHKPSPRTGDRGMQLRDRYAVVFPETVAFWAKMLPTL
jgi:hypothetical protein